MNFLQLQEELQAFTLDDSTAFEAGGASNKTCIARGYEDCFLECLNDETVRKTLATYPQSSLTPLAKVSALPADFFRMYRVSTMDFSVDSQIDILPEFYDYDIMFDYSTSLYQFVVRYQSNIKFYYRYIKKLVPLSDDADIPVLPEILHRNIVDYALIHYYRMQRDSANMTQALQDARFRLAERLEQFSLIA